MESSCHAKFKVKIMTTSLHDAIKRDNINKSVFKALVATSVNLTFPKKEVLKLVPCAHTSHSLHNDTAVSLNLSDKFTWTGYKQM